MKPNLVRLDGTGLRFAIVAGKFNDLISERLVDGALEALVTHGVAADDIEVRWGPGAWELPVIAAGLARRGGIDGIIVLGAVIRGSTDHYTHVAGQCAAALMRLQMDTGMPVAFGVLTTDSLEQCLERSGSKVGNKGIEAAMAALEAALVLRSLA
ncbi:MAG: 6,7-dimethyl-8-ribityllumazine synthase [Acidimicrobiales bacterium]